jgi:hypothetical protein
MTTDTNDSITNGMPMAKYTEGTQRSGEEGFIILDLYCENMRAKLQNNGRL